jgi:hypothetical protein
VPNLVLAFAELLAGSVILDAAIKGDSIGNVIRGTATQQPITGASGTGTGTIGGAVSGAAGSYVNPVPGASGSRIDEGGDYTLGSQGFLAPGRSKIIGTAGSFFQGGNIWGQFLDGPLAGQYWLVGEGVKPAAGIAPGTIVQAGQKVADAVASPYNGIVGNIEAGFSDHNGIPLAQSTGGYSEGQTTAAGVAWDHFVTGLGGVVDDAKTAVRGHLTGVLGTLETGATLGGF